MKYSWAEHVGEAMAAAAMNNSEGPKISRHCRFVGDGGIRNEGAGEGTRRSTLDRDDPE
jgi:hypothetical protein